MLPAPKNTKEGHSDTYSWQLLCYLLVVYRLIKTKFKNVMTIMKTMTMTMLMINDIKTEESILRSCQKFVLR